MLEALEDIGLSHGESKVYLALLEQGSATVTALAKATGLYRTYIYDVLRKMTERGLVRYRDEDDARVFSPIDPYELSKQLRERVDQFDKMLPRLAMTLKLASKKQESLVVVSEGMASIISALGVYGQASDRLSVLGWPTASPSLVTDRLRRSLEESQSLGASVELLVFGDQVPDHLSTSMRTRCIRSPDSDEGTVTWIGNGCRIHLLDMRPPYRMTTIQDQAMARFYQLQFRLLWKQGKEESGGHPEK